MCAQHSIFIYFYWNFVLFWRMEMPSICPKWFTSRSFFADKQPSKTVFVSKCNDFRNKTIYFGVLCEFCTYFTWVDQHCFYTYFELLWWTCSLLRTFCANVYHSAILKICNIDKVVSTQHNTTQHCFQISFFFSIQTGLIVYGKLQSICKARIHYGVMITRISWKWLFNRYQRKW